MNAPVVGRALSGQVDTDRRYRMTDAILQILMGVLLAVMAAETYTAGPNVSTPMLVGMAAVAVAVAVRELLGRRHEATGLEPVSKEEGAVP